MTNSAALTFFLLLPLTGCFWGAFALFSLRQTTQSQKWLALMFILQGVVVLFALLDLQLSDNMSSNALSIMSGSFAAYFAISVLFYFVALMHPQKITKNFLIKHVMIAVAYTLVLFSLELFMGDIANKNIAELGLLKKWIHYWEMFLLWTVEIYVLIKTMKLYTNYRRYIKAVYSYENDISLKWVKYLMALFLLLAASSLAWVSLSYFIVSFIFGILTTLIIAFIFWFGFRQNELPPPDEFVSLLTQKDKRMGKYNIFKILVGYERQLRTQLVDYLEQSQVYLRSDLSLDQLSVMLQTEPAYVLLAIQHSFKTNFSDFINKYRIEHAIKLVENREVVKEKEIAAESGFKDINTFRLQFENATGCSLAEYKSINNRISKMIET